MSPKRKLAIAIAIAAALGSAALAIPTLGHADDEGPMSHVDVTASNQSGYDAELCAGPDGGDPPGPCVFLKPGESGAVGTDLPYLHKLAVKMAPDGLFARHIWFYKDGPQDKSPINCVITGGSAANSDLKCTYDLS